MWGTFLSEPLPIVALVGRYPANKLMGRIPILYQLIFICRSHAERQTHPVLNSLSGDYPGVKGRLDTRYSPVRRSPSGNASISHAAPRLACVKPVASVHPEPGSNSTLYNILLPQPPFTKKQRRKASFALSRTAVFSVQKAPDITFLRI